MPSWPLEEPVGVELGLVCALVVHDDVNVEIGSRVRLRFVEKSTGLLGVMSVHAPTDLLTGFHVEVVTSRLDAMAFVFVGPPFDRS